MILFVSECVLLMMHNFMENFSHYKLVKQDDAKDCYENNNSCKCFEVMSLLKVGLMVLHLDGRNEQFSFWEKNKVKNDSDYNQE